MKDFTADLVSAFWFDESQHYQPILSPQTAELVVAGQKERIPVHLLDSLTSYVRNQSVHLRLQEEANLQPGLFFELRLADRIVAFGEITAELA